jgi:hypothetical protein
MARLKREMCMNVMRHDARQFSTAAGRAVSLVGASYLLVSLLSLLPRVLDLGSFLTVDEADHWIERSEQFLAAIRSGNAAATAITGHPGVTTMWLGSLGLLLHQGAIAWALVPADSFAAKLALMQLPVALVNAGAVVLGYHLLRRLLPATTALCAALLWAADPFVIGYSRVLHVDALTGTWVTISALAACAYWHHRPRGWLLVLSGCGAGLALLSKSPAVVVVPLVAAIALRSQPVRSASRALAIWAACCALTIVVLWPAVLAVPSQVFDLIRTGVEENGAVPHSNGDFFLGRSDPAPGPLFYPVALVLRTTPWTLLGLLLVPYTLRRAAPPMRRDMAMLAALVLALVVGLSLFPKKHNRYLEPAFPAVDILAAAGLIGVVPSGPGRARQAAGACALLGVAAGVNATFWHPYGIVAFNQVLGGAPAGAQNFLIGWGEGMDQAAAWLNQQPDITDVLTSTTLKEPLSRYLRPGARVNMPRLDIPAETGYMVVYARNVQEGPPEYPFDQFYGRVTPIHVVEIHGVPYVWIYQVRQPVAHRLPSNFGSVLHLRGYDLAQDPTDSGTYKLRLFWRTRGAVPTDYAAFVHLIGPDGRRYAQIDPRVPTSRLDANRLITTDLALRLPPDAPPATYKLVLGLYDPTSGQRLSLSGPVPADPALDGPDAVLLDTIRRGS